MPLDNTIHNEGLLLSMEFGKNWLADIDNRLVKKYPNLSKTELRTCDRLCRQINKKAHDLIRKNPIKTDEGVEFMDFDVFKKALLADYEWITVDNLSKLYSQSCYYVLR